MQSKSLLIAIAAFAVTTTGVQAYSDSKLLVEAGLTEEQVAALEEAHELRSVGDYDAARDVLIEAEITEETLDSLRRISHAEKNPLHDALEADDYDAFLEAIADTPLADIITTEDDFEAFREAHDLRMQGEWTAAADLFSDLGVDASGKHPFYGRGQARVLAELTDEQREAFLVAKRGNDRETMRAILDEAGVVVPHARMHRFAIEDEE